MISVDSHKSEVRESITRYTVKGDYRVAIKFALGFMLRSFVSQMFNNYNVVVLSQDPETSLDVFATHIGDGLLLFKPHIEQAKASPYPKYDNAIFLEGTHSRVFMCDVWTLHDLFERGFANIDVILSVDTKIPLWVDYRVKTQFPTFIEVERGKN